MGIVDYAYSNTRIRVMKSHLLKNSDLETLTRAKNLNDCLMSLKQTHYGEILSRLEKVTIREIEKHLSIDLMRTISKISRISPPDCVPFLSAISKKYEFEYIKLILNSKMGNLSPEEIRDNIPVAEVDHSFGYKHTEEFLSRLIDLPVETITALLCGRYKGLDEFMLESPDPLDTLIALDRYYFSELQNSLGTLKGGDRKAVSMLISMEVDIANIMIILRSITHGYAAGRFIIPGHDPHINELGEHTPKDVTDAIAKLSKTVYGPLLEDTISVYTETNSLLQMELTLKRYLAEQGRIIMYNHPFQLGFILGFLKLKESEIENLRAVCIGVNEGLSSDGVRELLILPSATKSRPVSG